MEERIIFVKDYLHQSTNAVTTDEGVILYEIIEPNIRAGYKVVLNFIDVNLIISTFLNASIGQLYSKFSSQQIRDHLNIINMDPDDLVILKKVVERAKDYFANNDIEELYKKHFPNAGEDTKD